MQKLKKYFLILVVLGLLFTAISGSVYAATIPEGIPSEYLPQWQVDVNITIYVPDTTQTLSMIDLKASNWLVDHYSPSILPNDVIDRVNLYYQKAGLPVKVERTGQDLLAINELVLMSTTNSSSDSVDVLPDEEAQKEVTQDPLAQMGLVSKYYENLTDFDTAATITFDFTDYNYSQYKYLLLEDFKQHTAGNALVKVYWANNSGQIYSTPSVVINETDILVSQNWWAKIPTPPDSIHTYVAKITVTNAYWTRFVVFSASDFQDSRTLDSSFTMTEIPDVDAGAYMLPAVPHGFFDSISATVQNNIARIPTPKDVTSMAARGIGFSNVRTSILNAAARKAGISPSLIQDHVVNSMQDTITVTKTLAGAIATPAKEGWNRGEKTAQQLALAGRKNLKAITVAVGVKAEEFKEKAEKGADIAGTTIKNAIKTGGKPFSLKSASSLISSVLDSTGKLLPKSAGMFSFFNGDLWKSAKNSIIWIVAIIIVILVLVVVAKLA